MGPILIFDKSVLQSLNPDEAMWLDNFYLCNITPLFFIETLADLEKQVKNGRTPEDVVGNLALKTPDMHSKPNVHHTTLLEAELVGAHEIDMKYGRPHIAGGQSLQLGDQTGVIFQPAPEEEAMRRWEDHEFLDLERLTAKAWRRNLSNIDFEEHYKFFQKFFPIGKPKTLQDVKRIVDFHVDGSDQRSVLIFGLTLLGITRKGQAEIIDRWNGLGKPPIRKFAPYFTHVVSVDFFFYLAIAADLIGRDRPSHKIDWAYLYYLPFCMVFTSNDKLHANTVPLFLRENQSYISGTELKEDLSKLDKHYDALSDEVKQRGVTSFAFYPPDDTTFLITRLWDKHMARGWRENAVKPKPNPQSESGKKLMEHIKRFEKEGKPIPDNVPSSTNPDQMILRRMVRAHRGKWTMFPPEVLRRRKNEKDEWEDIPTEKQ